MANPPEKKGKAKEPAPAPPKANTYAEAVAGGYLPTIHAALSGGQAPPPPPSPSASGDSTGASGGSPASSPDYSSLFYAFGMSPSMVTQINNLMGQLISSGMTADDAYNIIVGEIRGGSIGANYANGQSWYQYTYGGIGYGIANGLLDSSNPEASYRSYVNSINNYYKQYLGRDATTAEILGYLQGGVSDTTAGHQLAGQSYANAYSGGDANAMGYSWNALLGAFGQLPNGEKQLSAQEKLALGEENTGYQTTLGDQLNKQLQTAYTRLQTIFKGTLATPADLQKAGSGLKAPSLSAETTPDVAPI